MVKEIRYNQFEKQKEVFHSIINTDIKYHLLNISRGGGKTVLITHIMIYYLLNDEANDILFVSRTIPQTKKVFKQLIDSLEKSGLRELITEINLSERFLKAENGSQISFKGGERADSLRGQNEHTIVICDEFAFFHPDTWNQALRQICGVQKVKKVIIASTPNGFNDFYSLCKTAQESIDNYYKYYEYNYKHNPYGQNSKDVEDAKKSMPLWLFNQEYECQFIGDGFSAFNNIEDICILNRDSKNGRLYCAGIDIGLKNDYTVVTIMNELGEMIDYIRFNNVETDVWVNKVAGFINKYNPRVVIAEENYESTLLKLLRLKSKSPITFHRTNANKKEDVEKLIVNTDLGNVKLLNDKLLKEEMEQFTKINTATTYTYRASVGTDDIVMSLVLCNLAYDRIKTGNSIKIR